MAQHKNSAQVTPRCDLRGIASRGPKIRLSYMKSTEDQIDKPYRSGNAVAERYKIGIATQFLHILSEVTTKFPFEAMPHR
jgi:hypothetical protein